MLVTRRREGEALLIGDNIEVMVLEIGQGRVKLGVSAPADVPVERKEWRLVEEQNRDASASADSAFVQGILSSGDQTGEAPTVSLSARPRKNSSQRD